jgi:predicted tellurium resistance membrane protein TerC
MEWLTDPSLWIAFFTLTVLEIVLGIDNIVFISILAGRLPVSEQAKARRIGLMLAMVTRILLLVLLAWMIRLTSPLFEVLGHPFSGRDLILSIGGLFLVAKATREIHHKLEGEDRTEVRVGPSLRSVILQIMVLDIVFSLDSVVTAVGMVDQIGVMIAAIKTDRGVCRPPSDGKNARTQLFAVDRLYIDCGGVWTAYLQGVYLLCDGIQRIRRNVEPAPAKDSTPAGPFA